MENQLDFGGRRKACAGQGLTGKEKKACAKQLKSSGWKKGQPIPPDMAGITHTDVSAAEKATADAALGTPPEEGMSTGVKVLIGGGIFVALLVGGFFILRARKKAKV
jgi:hypothetical protein